MVARDVERLEVVVVGLDLGPLGDREAEAGEDRDDLVVDARQRMQRPPRRAAARQREAEPPTAPLGLSLRLVGRGEPRVQQAFELALGLVRSRADERALIRRQRAERSQELRQGALAAEHADAARFELGGRLRRGDRLSRLLDDGVDARVPHELPALGSSGLGELRERGRIGHRQLRQHLAIEVDPRLLERGHEFRVREPYLAARRVDPHDPEAPRLALLLLAAAVRERPSPQDGLGGGLVELPAATEIPLRLLEDLLAPSARLRSTLCPWHSPTPPGSQIGHEHPQPGLVRFVDQFRRTESPATLGILLLELVLLPAAGPHELARAGPLEPLPRPPLGLHLRHPNLPSTDSPRARRRAARPTFKASPTA